MRQLCSRTTTTYRVHFAQSGDEKRCGQFQQTLHDSSAQRGCRSRGRGRTERQKAVGERSSGTNQVRSGCWQRQDDEDCGGDHPVSFCVLWGRVIAPPPSGTICRASRQRDCRGKMEAPLRPFPLLTHHPSVFAVMIQMQQLQTGIGTHQKLPAIEIC